MNDKTQFLRISFVIWLLIGGSALLAAKFGMWMMASYMVLLFLASPIALVIYGIDKRRAIIRSRRIPEKVLHLCELAGGWPGAYVAQQYYRHKTKNSNYLTIYHGIVVLHMILISIIALQSGH